MKQRILPGAIETIKVSWQVRLNNVQGAEHLLNANADTMVID